MTEIAERSLALHKLYRGKLGTTVKTPLTSPDDLSLVYTPGVGAVSTAVANDPPLVWEVTNRANTVAIVSDGSAVLGLGNIGPGAALPVMEGKAVLFRELGGVDAVPLVLGTQDPGQIISIVTALAPSFGGVNLEDIAAPACFLIEEALQGLGIPVFHDDQWGTAIVVLGAITNAARVVGKPLESLKVVMAGAGAAGIAIAKMLAQVGVANVLLLDSRGAIGLHRADLTAVKQAIAMVTNPAGLRGSLAEVLPGADVFIGVSAANTVTAEMVKTMASDPIVLALANPDPEILPDEAKAGGAAVVGTGRSDFPNQVNNVLAFPGIFRGAFDVRATAITMEMKIQAGLALAELVKDPTPEHILPAALDRAAADAVSAAVARTWRLR